MSGTSYGQTGDNTPYVSTLLANNTATTSLNKPHDNNTTDSKSSKLTTNQRRTALSDISNHLHTKERGTSVSKPQQSHVVKGKQSSHLMVHEDVSSQITTTHEAPPQEIVVNTSSATNNVVANNDEFSRSIANQYIYNVGDISNESSINTSFTDLATLNTQTTRVILEKQGSENSDVSDISYGTASVNEEINNINCNLNLGDSVLIQPTIVMPSACSQTIYEANIQPHSAVKKKHSVDNHSNDDDDEVTATMNDSHIGSVKRSKNHHSQSKTHSSSSLRTASRSAYIDVNRNSDVFNQEDDVNIVVKLQDNFDSVCNINNQPQSTDNHTNGSTTKFESTTAVVADDVICEEQPVCSTITQHTTTQQQENVVSTETAIVLSSAQDDTAAFEYEDSIYLALIQAESLYLPRSDYIENIQPQVTHEMRGILVDWLVEVCLEYKLKTQTFFLTVHYIDRLLSIVPISRTKLQLVGITTLLVASKYEEITPPTIDQLVYIADNTYPREHVIQMESILLDNLQFSLSVPTSYEFMVRFSRAGQLTGLGVYIAEFIIETCAGQPVYLQHRSSAIAAAAVCIARFVLLTQNYHQDNLARLQRLRDMYLSSYLNQNQPVPNDKHPAYKACMAIDSLPQDVVVNALIKSWPDHLGSLTRFTLHTLIPCILAVNQILVCTMGYGANRSNPFRNAPQPGVSMDLIQIQQDVFPITESIHVQSDVNREQLTYCDLPSSTAVTNASTKAVFSKYAHENMQYIAERFIPPLDLTQDALLMAYQTIVNQDQQ